jgi:hypothetical protein
MLFFEQYLYIKIYIKMTKSQGLVCLRDMISNGSRGGGGGVPPPPKKNKKKGERERERGGGRFPFGYEKSVYFSSNSTKISC